MRQLPQNHPLYPYINLDTLPGNTDLDLLWRLIKPVFLRDNSDCWYRNIDTTVYTTIKQNGKYKPAHRVSYELFKGYQLIHQGCHTCDVRCCINPGHIFDGTQSRNIQDCKSKGRLVELQSLELDKYRKYVRNNLKHEFIDYSIKPHLTDYWK